MRVCVFTVGEIISSGFGVVGFSWICSPACTELEVVVMDWLGKFLNLPPEFLNCTEGPGGGVIQGKFAKKTIYASNDKFLSSHRYDYEW